MKQKKQNLVDHWNYKYVLFLYFITFTKWIINILYVYNVEKPHNRFLIFRSKTFFSGFSHFFCLSYTSSLFWIVANFDLHKFRLIHSWINLSCQPVGSHLVWTSGPTTCFLVKINHHLWVLTYWTSEDWWRLDSVCLMHYDKILYKTCVWKIYGIHWKWATYLGLLKSSL